jgi:hypothetical protein
VDLDGVVQGARIPFQFHPKSEGNILVVTSKGKVEEIEQHNKGALKSKPGAERQLCQPPEAELRCGN